MAGQGAWRSLIDDLWVVRADGVERVPGRPVKAAGNPLIGAGDPWSLNPYLFGSVLHEPERGFRMWYMTHNDGFAPPERAYVLYAESEDGLAWRRPELGLCDFRGSRRNNIVLTSYGHAALYSPSVVSDPRAPPDRRYLMAYSDFVDGPVGYRDNGLCVAWSADGIAWRRAPNNPVAPLRRSDLSISDVLDLMVEDEGYVIYAKGWSGWRDRSGGRFKPDFRHVLRATSRDGETWSEAQVVLSHAWDAADPQSYGMAVGRCDDAYVGLLRSYKSPGDGTIDIRLASSRDGRDWSYPGGNRPFIGNGDAGAWDAGMIFAARPLTVGEVTFLYFGGWNGPHHAKDRRAGVGLATLPRGRWSGLSAGGEARLVLGPLTAAPRAVRFNVEWAAGGRLQAGFCHADGQPWPGTVRAAARPTGAAAHVRLEWPGRASRPSDGPMYLWVGLRNATLFAFAPD